MVLAMIAIRCVQCHTVKPLISELESSTLSIEDSNSPVGLEADGCHGRQMRRFTYLVTVLGDNRFHSSLDDRGCWVAVRVKDGVCMNR